MLIAALGALRRAQRFRGAAILVLALGVLNTAVTFRILEATALQYLPVPRPSRLVEVRWRKGQPPLPSQAEASPGLEPGDMFSLATFRALASAEPNPARWLAFSPASQFPEHTLLTVEGRSSYTNETVVSGSYFEVLDLAPASGRLILPNDDRARSQRVAVVSYDVASAQFGVASQAVGRNITLDGIGYQVVGVAPADFTGLRRGVATGVWVPIATWAGLKPAMAMSMAGHVFADKTQPDTDWLAVFGRLNPTVTRSTATARVAQVIAGSVTSTLHIAPSALGGILLRDGGAGTGGLASLLAPGLRLLFAIALVAFLATCGCIAVMFWARALRRRREIAIRRSLGAPPSLLLTQEGLECLLTVTPGVLLGGVFSVVASPGLAALWAGPASDMGFKLAFHGVSGSFLALLGSAIAVATVFAMVPLVRPIYSSGIASSLAGAQPKYRPIQPFGALALLTVQVALSLLVVAAGIICARTLQRVNHRSLGYNPKHLLSFTIYPERQGYSIAAEGSLVRRILARLRSVPGVLAAGASADPPASGFAAAGFIWPTGAKASAQPSEVIVNAITPGYLKTLGVRFVSGHGLDVTASGGPLGREIVLSQAAAHALFPDDDAVGHLISFSQQALPEATFAVVGVARNVSQPTEAPGGLLYALYDSSSIIAGNARKDGVTLVVRTRGNPRALVPGFRVLVQQIAPNLAAPQFTTVRSQLATLDGSDRFAAYTTGGLALLALVLAVASTWGLQDCLARSRTRENGIELALGASRAHVVQESIRATIMASLLGLIIGIGLSWAASRMIAHAQFGLAHLSIASLGPGSAVLAIAVVVGLAGPARKVANSDPAILLREE